MRPSVLFNLVGGGLVVGIGAVAVAVLRADALDRPVLGSWSDLLLVPFVLLGAWVVVHATYGAEMNGRVNDANRKGREIKAAIRKAFAAAKADDPGLPDLNDASLDRCADVIDLDLRRDRPAPDLRTFLDLAEENRRADAELGGLKPSTDKDD